MLIEDIEWAVEVISKNKLYAAGYDNIKYSKDRPELWAWLNMINLTCIPVNNAEIKLSAENEEEFKI